MSTTATTTLAETETVFIDGAMQNLVEELCKVNSVTRTLSRTFESEVSIEDAVHCATISVWRNDLSGRENLRSAISAVAQQHGLSPGEEKEALRLGIEQYYLFVPQSEST